MYEIEYIFDKLWNVKKYGKNNKITDIIINGKGLMKEYECSYYSNLMFEGEYINGEKNGKGKEYYGNKSMFVNKLKFEGEYLNGERNGNGKEYYENAKLKFEGGIYKWRKKWKRKRI